MDDKILYYEDLIGFIPGFRHPYLVQVAHWAKDVGPVPGTAAVQGEVLAYVNHGRWVAQCPDCRSALVCSREHPLFFCTNCGNASNGRKWKAVIYPANRDEIESVLLDRIAAHPYKAVTRNWDAVESVADLRRQNQDHPHGVRRRDGVDRPA